MLKVAPLLELLLFLNGSVCMCPLQELKDIIAPVKPHALIGLSAAGPSWPEEVVRQLCAEVECPLIFPLSNPTDKAEITAEQAYK